jgi:hypothetical protein
MTRYLSNYFRVKLRYVPFPLKFNVEVEPELSLYICQVVFDSGTNEPNVVVFAGPSAP